MDISEITRVTMAHGANSGTGGAGQPGPGPQQSQQPQQPSHTPPSGDASSTATDDGGGSGGGCGKGCLGCGCLGTIALVALIAIGGVVAYTQAPDALGADGWDEVVEMVEGADRAMEAVETVERADGGVEPDVPDDDVENTAQLLESFVVDLEETAMTGRDVDDVRGDLERWADSEVVREFYETHDALENFEDEESVLRQLMNLRHITRFAFNINRLGEDYKESIEDQMGPAYRQLSVITRVSQLGSDSDIEPWEQEVADALIDDHDEHREEYEESRELIRKVATEDFDPDDLSEEEQMRLAEAYSDQMLMMTVAVNRDSLETWQAMSDDERQAVIEELDAPHNWFGRIAASIFHTEEGDEHMIFWRMMGL